MQKFRLCCFDIIKSYDDVLLLGFTHSGLNKLIHCLGFFCSTRKDKYGIAAKPFLEEIWYFPLFSLHIELFVVSC